MRSVVLAVVLAATVGAPFGDAEASGRRIGETSMEIDLSVSAPTGAVIVAHLVAPGGGDELIPLRERDPGIYGAVVEVRPADFSVVFESVPPDPAVSLPRSLTDLGLDPAVLGGAASVDPPGARWPVLVLGLVSAVLSLILVRVALVDRER